MSLVGTNRDHVDRLDRQSSAPYCLAYILFGYEAINYPMPE
ncbi:hypothetical protein [Cylindrospermopsis raciborskii]